VVCLLLFPPREGEEELKVDLAHVMGRVFRQTGRVEPPFCSKVVATVRPELPVYDQHVRMNLTLKVPPPHLAPEARLEGFTATYARLEMTMGELVGDPDFARLRAAFDRTFPEYRHFTDTKKLDLLLWQHGILR
jgi:hypothetical protein